MNHARRVLGAVLLIASATPTVAAAQQTVIGGQVRPRFETREVTDGPSSTFSSMETRLSVAHALSTDARLMFMIQDARIWGEELSPTEVSGDALDMVMAYIELGHRGESPLWARVGRQEIDLAEGRLIGTPVWRMGGRFFDGVRAAWKASGSTTVEAFGMQLQESVAREGESDAALYGLWSQTDLGDGRDLQLFVFHDRDEATPRTARTTAGGYYLGASGIVSYRGEAYYQTGEARGLDVDAYFFTGRIGAPVFQGRGDAALQYDYYSGDASPEASTSGAFSDLLGRNHRFLGFADLIRNVPQDTGGRGVQDLALRLGWSVLDDGRLSVDLHRFLAADAEGLDGSRLYDEVDVTLQWPTPAGVEVLSGIAYVAMDADGTAVGLAQGNVFFGYLQLRAAF